MKFSEYTRMENEYNILKLDQVKDILLDDSVEWVGLEKIHGTNSSFISDGLDVLTCRRSDILKSNENFYSHLDILEKYKFEVIKLFGLVNNFIYVKKNKLPIQIQLYGELYGGTYKNYENQNKKSIQKGIYYSNTHEFACFDLKYWVELKEEPEYLDWDVLEELISNTSFQTVPIIKKGKYSELTLLNPKFESEVYKIHSFPKLESNYAEGLVIKPVSNIYIGQKYTERLIWKFKNPSFSEIVKNSGKKISNTKLYNQEIVEQLENYVCTNRYDNVVSKVIEGTQVDKVVELFYNDIWVDFTSDLDILGTKLEDDDKKECEKKLKGLANKFVRTRY